MSKVIDFRRILITGAPKLFGKTGKSRAKTSIILAIVSTAAISIFAAGLALPSKIMANDDNDSEVKTFTVDVAFRSSYAQNNVDPTETLKNPLAFSPGDTFIQDGVIFPGNTIPDGPSPFDPETHPGAIGVYRARGTWTTNLEDFTNASERGKDVLHRDMAFATEMFSFTSDLGTIRSDRSTIMTDGNLPNAYFSARRVVIGGTRGFRDVVGEVHEENIGENLVPSCNLRVTFKVRNAGAGRGR
jgi:hypothetical protein